MRVRLGFKENQNPASRKGSRPKRRRLALGLMLSVNLSWFAASAWAAEPGVGEKSIVIGATMPLEGDHKPAGLALKKGIESALNNQSIRGLRVEYTALNDFYDPTKTVESLKPLLQKGVFLVLGSYGTPTLKAALPLLAEHKIPVLAPFSGAALTGPGELLNVRASYGDEVDSVVDMALAAGVKPTEICAYAQNDTYGMSGVKGMRQALAKLPENQKIVAKLDELLEVAGDNPARNNIGPVGVYQRETTNARSGYDSLKKWETDNGTRCRLVLTAGTYNAISTFIAYARYKNEPWVVSTVSFGSGAPLVAALKEKGTTNKVIATEIVPPPNSPLPLVADARKALGSDLNSISLEGYLDGKLFLAILQAIEGPVTRENFLKAARRQIYDIGGFKVDFTTDNQGSDFVALTILRDGQFVAATSQELAALFK